MPVNLLIEDAPDQIVSKLRARAARHQRSLQGEILAIIEAAMSENSPVGPAEVLSEVRRMGLNTPSESTELIRAARDGRPGR
jgi:plasmid stability protein